MESDPDTAISRNLRVGSNDLGNGADRAEFFLSIVVPVYKEEGNVLEFLSRISGILWRMLSGLIRRLSRSREKNERSKEDPIRRLWVRRCPFGRSAFGEGSSSGGAAAQDNVIDLLQFRGRF